MAKCDRQTRWPVSHLPCISVEGSRGQIRSFVIIQMTEGRTTIENTAEGAYLLSHASCRRHTALSTKDPIQVTELKRKLNCTLL